MLALTGLSLATTPRGLRKEVEFGYGAILEVACLFLGIFLTMQVPDRDPPRPRARSSG